jgi:hypothetical protein
MKSYLLLGTLLCCVSCGPSDDNLDSGISNSDGGFDANVDSSCRYPQQAPPGAANDPKCPTQYGGPAGSLCTPPRQPCANSGLTCRYYGAGDGVPGCWAIAEMSCQSTIDWDAGTDGGAAWVCAN